MSYPDTVNLPFNRACLRDSFRPLSPDTVVTDEPGFLLLIRGEELLLLDEDESLLLPYGSPPQGVDPDTLLLMGSWEGRPLRTGRLSPSAPLPAQYAAEPFNAYSTRLDDRLLTLGGIARILLAWNHENSHCPRCGGESRHHPGSWGKSCMVCGVQRFPPTHPCAIVLVRRGEEFLLGRKAVWPQGRYSLIAGFLDVGESLEECAQREVLEETGIRITNLHYVGSQCWPFPSQVMAGFVADYAGGELSVADDELEDARWFTSHSPPLSLPGRRSIARWIIDRYALGNLHNNL